MELTRPPDPRLLRCLTCGHNWCELERKTIDKFGAAGAAIVEVAREQREATKERCPKCFNDRVTRVQGDPPQMRHCEGCGYDWDQSAVAQVMREALARRPFPKLGLTLKEGMPNPITGGCPVRVDDGGAFPIGDGALQDAMRRLEEANARIERLREKIEKQEEESVRDYNEIAELARRICVAQFQPIAQGWEPLKDIRGVTSQLSNMAAGLSDRIAGLKQLVEVEHDRAEDLLRDRDEVMKRVEHLLPVISAAGATDAYDMNIHPEAKPE